MLRFSQLLLLFQPICLPDDDETYAGCIAYVTGWGGLYDGGPVLSMLREVAVPVTNNSICEALVNACDIHDPQFTQIYICTSYMNDGFGPWKGDSGGPMVIQRARDKRRILAGIVSGGNPCPDVAYYMRISVFREWINQILQF